MLSGFLQSTARAAARGWADPSAGIIEALTGGRRARSGVSVTDAAALGVPAVYAAVNVLAQTLAQLPCKVERQLSGGGSVAERNHPLYSVVHDLANPEMTSYDWRSTAVGHVALRGNHYSEIERDSSNRVIGLWPLRPDKMKIERAADGALHYIYTLPNGQDHTFRRDPRGIEPSPILHLRGLSSDGLVGYSPVTVAREALGLAIAAEGFGAAFFGAGAAPSMAIKLPGKIKPDAQTRLRNNFERLYSGLDRAHRIAILEEGMSIEKIGLSQQDSQFLETRRFQVEEIARIFRVPPHMLQDLSRATFSNIEHQAISFVVHTVMPWVVSLEQAMGRDLLSVKSWSTHQIKFAVDGLLRGDTQTRYAAYNIGRQGGWLSVNEIRRLEGLNPIKGGDEYLRPLNMTIAGGDGAPADPNDPEAARAALVAHHSEALARLLRAA
jgi:HK97 family phage portal protein